MPVVPSARVTPSRKEAGVYLPDADEEAAASDEEVIDEVDDSMHIFTGHTGEVYTIACSPRDASLVATGGGDDKGFLWKIGQGDWARVIRYVLNKPPTQFEVQMVPEISTCHKDSVSSLAFSADGQLLASGSFEGLIQVWDISSGNLKVYTRRSGHGSSVTSGDFTPDGKTICIGSDDATLRIWNPKSGENIHVVSSYPYNTEGLTCLKISSDSNLALTGSKDSSVHIVNITNGKATMVVLGSVHSSRLMAALHSNIFYYSNLYLHHTALQNATQAYNAALVTFSPQDDVAPAITILLDSIGTCRIVWKNVAVNIQVLIVFQGRDSGVGCAIPDKTDSSCSAEPVRLCHSMRIFHTMIWVNQQALGEGAEAMDIKQLDHQELD
ncbi:hypothetical protein LguiA_006653 [Lonicera macranthoides]